MQEKQKQTLDASKEKKKPKKKEKKESFFIRDYDFDEFSSYDYSTEFNNYLSTKYEE